MAHLQTNTKRETAISLYPDPELQSPVHFLTYSESQNTARTLRGEQPTPEPTLNSTWQGCSSATETDISEQLNYDFPVLLLCSPLAGAQGDAKLLWSIWLCLMLRVWALMGQATASSKPRHAADSCEPAVTPRVIHSLEAPSLYCKNFLHRKQLITNTTEPLC